jgi:hypothetical protein
VERSLPLATVLMLALLFGCASVPSPGDAALEWSGASAELYFVDPSGQPLKPFGSHMVGLPGYLFTQRGSVKLHPGTHWIKFGCPRPPDIAVSHWVPMVQHTFSAGRSYELRCNGHVPVIRERSPDA